MNRFEYISAKLGSDESFVCKDESVKLFDGNNKTSFEDGEVVLTTHRLFWGRPGEIARGGNTLCLHLRYVNSLGEEEASSNFFGKKKRIILNLNSPRPDKQPGPMDTSSAYFIKLSGKNGMEPGFYNSLSQTISAKIWEISEKLEEKVNEESPRIKLRTGIVGIERSLLEKQKATDQSISLAFKDLSKLMEMAKDMVNISKGISNKIRERQGDISEDETVRFKSYLMSLGIDDPVTRDNFQNSSDYHKSLANQICEMLLDPITKSGGMMSLTEVYCRVNRARGLELLSPEDLLNACKLLNNGLLVMRKFPSGAIVLQLESHSDEVVAEETSQKVEESKSLSSEELARILGISLILAQERLFTSERAGKICRDESMEGLRFYPNLFLKNI